MWISRRRDMLGQGRRLVRPDPVTMIRPPMICAAAALALLAGACGAPRGDSGAAAGRKEFAAGRELYERHGCALCHGPEGRGDGPVAPTLDPPPRDLADPSAYRIGPSEDEIASTLEEGILVFGGSGMPSYAHIPADERRELARYVASLQGGAGSDGPGGGGDG